MKMKLPQSCWSPIIWTNSIRTATKAIAFYTIAISLVLITFIAYQMRGGDSTQLYNPLFEADVRFSLQVIGGFFIYYLLQLIFFAGLMIYGLNRNVRGWLLPWLVTWFIVCLFQLIFGLWLVYGYYIYLEATFAAFFDWIWMGYNIYCWLVVYGAYKELLELQSPNIELLWP
ncbi:uncharacterized protein LOC131665796 [Phymastichus coffea]|uniref:uncharacterized protein LOC131665796 n=1 Tax=Phymastichus coffea TaxID=108790 RepID=UPI00273B736A|nr:uncharacterized protein LOC131665796 [Phymastichus coffea]